MRPGLTVLLLSGLLMNLGCALFQSKESIYLRTATNQATQEQTEPGMVVRNRINFHGEELQEGRLSRTIRSEDHAVDTTVQAQRQI